MKIASVVCGRNDGYKDFERGIIHFNSMLGTFDEVNYVDWNSPTGSYLWEIEDKIEKTGKIKHFIIPPQIVDKIILDPTAQKCNEAISRNIAIRRSNADWIVSTNIDIIPPSRKELEDLISTLDKNTFYTISRRELPKEKIEKYKDFALLRVDANLTIPERHFPAKVTPNDDFSLINCCGDFQIAHRNVWEKVRGFEEEMIHACFIDSNIQKKAILNGYNLKVLYSPGVFHMEHGAYYTNEDGTRILDPKNNNKEYKGDDKAYNNAYKWIENFTKTQNNINWGLKGINIQFEVI